MDEDREGKESAVRGKRGLSSDRWEETYSHKNAREEAVYYSKKRLGWEGERGAGRGLSMK